MSCMNACNRFWSSSTWKRKSRFDSVPYKTTMSFSVTCKIHLMVYRISTVKRALLTNVHYAVAHKYVCRVCIYPDTVRPIHFAIRLYYIARFTPRIESHDPSRVRSGSDTCKVYLPACLSTWMTRYLWGRDGAKDRKEMVVWALCGRFIP